MGVNQLYRCRFVFQPIIHLYDIPNSTFESDSEESSDESETDDSQAETDDSQAEGDN